MRAPAGVAILPICITVLSAASAFAADGTPPAFFRAGANVVLVNATVLDRHNRPVRGLSRNDFRLFEDKKEQSISYFSEEELPLSLAVVFDTSGSMAGKVSQAREALDELLRDSNSADEFSLVTFADRPQWAVPWTNNAGDILAAVLFSKPHGVTSLLDAVAFAVQRMVDARNPRRAVLILSDGGDNHSRFTEGHIARLLEEAGVELYAVDMSPAWITRSRSPEEFEGPQLLDRLCDDAGGRYFQVDGAKELAAAARRISLELRSQYVLGYTPPDTAADGRFHRVNLQIVPTGQAPKLSVYWRHGYRWHSL